MIITDVVAENVLKYRRLELHDLPEEGLIAIEGVNESGKSTIGEIICFGLFGRTYSLDQEGLDKLIRWDEPRCSASIRFRVDDRYRFEIARILDREGNQGARLTQEGKEEPVARGVTQVNEVLRELLGFGYEEFIESFYLAQREITTPHPHSHAVKAMAGITPMEALDREYAGEIREQQEAIAEARHETGQAAAALNDLAIDPQRLSQLEGEQEGLRQQSAALEANVERLEQAVGDYQDSLPEMRRTERRLGRARMARFLAFVASVLLFGGWYLVDRTPDSVWGRKLTSLLAGMEVQQTTWLLYGGALFAILFLLLWFRAGALKGHAARLRAVSQRLAGRLREAWGLRQGVVVEAGSADSEGLDEDQARIMGRIAAFQAEGPEVREQVAAELAWLRGEIGRLQEQSGRLEQALRVERERRDKAAGLERLIQTLEQNIAELEQHIQLRELGRELLRGAAGYRSQHFNRELRELVGRTLPLFTEGRYEHLQIDENLRVRVFSSGKRDFMDLEEISSGTQRQIMLAVRLALSQELIASMVAGKQFIFLDEPFAFFDEQRTSNAIKVLPELSDSITQIWIVAQTFPPDQPFSVRIHCTREQETLPADG
ncbi:MAG TPA: ATPase [Sedimenticola sp.]|nr:ATPase [Sedimenticola sp.]